MRSKSLLYLTLLLVLSSIVYSLGVATPYYVGEPLKIAPGETKEFNIYVANEEATESKVSAKMTESQGISKILDEQNLYSVPASMNNFPIKIQVKIPENTAVGTKYTLKVEVQQANPQSAEGGMITMGAGISRIIPVEVISKAPVVQVKSKDSSVIVTTIFVLIILLTIALLVFLEKRNQKKVNQTVTEQVTPVDKPQTNQVQNQEELKIENKEPLEQKIEKTIEKRDKKASSQKSKTKK